MITNLIPVSKSFWKSLGTALLLSLLVVIWWPGCRQYPEVSSPESLQMIKKIYTACSSRKLEQIESLDLEVEQLSRQGKMQPREVAAFQNIIALARAGDWSKAQSESLDFARDQVRE